jgi:hypothetical protein
MSQIITVNPPTAQTPGFAKRMRRVAHFQQAIEAGQVTPQLLDDLVQFLAEYCEGDSKQVEAYLWECSQEQFMEILSAVGGSGSQVPPQS